MANLTSNSLFILSALLFVTGLLFVAYPYLTLTVIALCALGYVTYTHGPALVRFYSQLSTKLWPGVDEHPIPCISNLFSGVDLPSPIPHVPTGLETVKNRRSPIDEIISSTPRSSPINHAIENPVSISVRASPQVTASDSRQLNFGKITPKSSRTHFQDVHLNNVEGSTSCKLRQRSNSAKTVQTTAGPLLSSARYNSPFDAGMYMNVNSPGFTDRLVRCANDGIGAPWGQGARQDRYRSVGLFPIVHLNAPSTPSLSVRNSQKAPNSSVRVRIAPPAYPEQRQHFNRGNSNHIKSSGSSGDSSRRNEVTKSVLDSLQEASRKRIYSQCQDEEDAGKKRQRKGDSVIPNPNCDMYQYRHIRPSVIPSTVASSIQTEINHKGKRVHEDLSSRLNEPKRLRQHGKPQLANNEISSSLSSSKTLLQRLSGNKRKAEIEYLEDHSGKHFKNSSSPSVSPTASRWLHSQPSDEEGSAARTQEVVRSTQSHKKSTPNTTSSVPEMTVQEKAVASGSNDEDSTCRTINISGDKISEKVESVQKMETDLSSKLFRKETTSRLHQKTTLSEKKGSSWTQDPPDADERCLSEQGTASELDRPERFQSLLSRMCGQDVHSGKRTDGSSAQVAPESSNNSRSTASINCEKDVLIKASLSSPSPYAVVSAPFSVPSITSSISTTNASHEMENKVQSISSMVPSQSSADTSSQTSTTVPFTPTSSNGSTLNGKMDKAAESTMCLPPPPNVNQTPTPAPKPMFSFPVQVSSSPLTLAPQTASAVASSAPSSVAPQSIFQLKSSSKETTTTTLSTSVADKSKDVASLLSNPLKPCEVPSQNTPFPSLSMPSQTAAASFCGNFNQSPGLSESTMKFPSQGQKIQFSSASSNFVAIQDQTNVTSLFAAPLLSQGSSQAQSAPPISSSGTTISSPVQCTPYSASTQQNTSSGFRFLGSSGNLFGGALQNGVATSFSFPAASTSVTNISPNNSTPDKAVGGAANLSTLDCKPTIGSGSITFGTVSTVAQQQPTNSTAFTFSPPVSGSSSMNEAYKAPYSFGGGSSSNVSSTPAFTNPSSQGSSSGFGSVPNSTPSAVCSTGSNQQHLSQGQNQQSNQGGFSFGTPNSSQNQAANPASFSFGSPTSQPIKTIAFGTGASSNAQIFGNGTSQQQPAFGASTTTAFSSQPAALTFSNSPFGTNTSSDSSSFGSQLPNASSFGAQVASNPQFGLPGPSNPQAFGTGASPTSSFGLPTSNFGANSSSAPAAPFNFGSLAERPTAPNFNFGGNNGMPAPTFSFANAGQQQSSSNTSLYQFGQASNPGSAFQFGPSSAQPGVFSFGASNPSFGTATNPVPLGSFTIGSGAPSFNMGSGPTAPQRSRALQTRRRRL